MMASWGNMLQTESPVVSACTTRYNVNNILHCAWRLHLSLLFIAEEVAIISRQHWMIGFIAEKGSVCCAVRCSPYVRGQFISLNCYCACILSRPTLGYYLNVVVGGAEDLVQDKPSVTQNSSQGSPDYEAWLTLEIEYDPLSLLLSHFDVGRNKNFSLATLQFYLR